jgi:hypothetical protein
MGKARRGFGREFKIGTVWLSFQTDKTLLFFFTLYYWSSYRAIKCTEVCKTKRTPKQS